MDSGYQHNEKTLQALKTFASFDQRQIFRFFVDGRFHKKYKGWRGYEDNEAGSVAGILNAYAMMIDNFDVAGRLSGNYIRQLHTACMAGVSTRNRKSTPGELRFLESGINLYRGNSTLASVRELLEQRRGDGNRIFHTPGYEEPAEAFTAEGILEALEKEGRLRYRAWYPNLDEAQQYKLSTSPSLADFYEVKHFVQMCYAERVDALIAAYNAETAQAKTDRDRLVAISRIVRDLELLHPFPDGNGRTFVAVLMNHLLLFNGFLPSILWDPNIDAELSVLEFADEIERGIANTRLLLDNPTAELYGYSIKQATQSECKEFLQLAHGFVTRLNTLIGKLTPSSSNDNALYLHLTPTRLSSATSGVWFNTDALTLERLRFNSIGVTPTAAPGRLLFCRDLKNWINAGRDARTEIAQAVAAGTTAIVVDDSEIAQGLPVPTLFVPDIDEALYDAGVWVRQSVACRAIAVVGTAAHGSVVRLLTQGAGIQRQVQVADDAACKTPQVMAALAGLHTDDQLAILGVATGARPNVARHRLRAIAPDICLFPAYDNVDRVDDKTFADILAALGACAQGIRSCGLAIVNSSCVAYSALAQELTQGAVPSMQTFGTREQDQGRLISSRLDSASGTWAVCAEIIGRRVDYRVADEQDVVASIGVLLALENLGCDIVAAASAFADPART